MDIGFAGSLDYKELIMNDVIRYIIEGDPTPLARPRFGRGKVWDSQKQIRISYGIVLSMQHGNRPLYEGPLHLDVAFFMSFPQRRKKQASFFHTARPDLDNCLKFISDCANGILYVDDSAICSISATKVYDVVPRTEFSLIPLRDIKKETPVG